MNNYIKVCDIEKYYGTASHVTKAIDRLSFSVNQGEFVGIMGASGSGKTTLLNLLATIDRVSSGHIFYENTDITALSEDALSEFRKHNLGFIFQQYNLLDTLTIEENIVLALTLQGGGKKKIRETCDRLLNLLHIEEIRGKFPYQVSGGQAQRCACARALANDPVLLLADEPTGALPYPVRDLHRPQPKTRRNHPDGNPRRLFRQLLQPYPVFKGRKNIP